MISTCFICGGLLNKFAKSSGFEIYKCTNCGFGVTDKPNLQKGEYHRDETYIDEEKLFKNIFQKRANIINRLMKPGRVLEIGCSTGALLFLLKEKGWEVVGVEISKSSAEVAQKKGIDVITIPFEKVKQDKKFDLIILNHTLEHLKKPQKVIEKISKIVNNSGYIYIDLPNYGSLSANLLKGHWPMLLPKEHLWHFTEKALKILLEKNGLEIIYKEKASGIWDFADPYSGVISSLINFKKRFFIEVLTAIPSWIVWKLGSGSDLMVIAKKT